MPENLVQLLYKIRVIVQQLGCVVQEEEYKADQLHFRGLKQGIIEESGLTRTEVEIDVTIIPFVREVQDAQVVVKLTPLKDDRTPKLGSNVIRTTARHAELELRELLKEYFS
jgi:hypothetical protein